MATEINVSDAEKANLQFYEALNDSCIGEAA